MSKIEELIEKLCPDSVEYRYLWELTAWDKKFSGIDRNKQKKIIKFKHIPAEKLKNLKRESGDIKLISGHILWIYNKRPC